MELLFLNLKYTASWMRPNKTPKTFGTRTNASRAARAHADHTIDAIVPMNDKRNGMYLTDLVSITVFTTANGAPYITILDITAKKPRNFDGDEDMNDTAIPEIVAIKGYERVRRRSFFWFETANLRKITQYDNSTIDTKRLTGISAVFPAVTAAYEIHRTH